MPFIYPPGTRWCYGTSIDWLSLLVEGASGLGFEAYVQKNIFGYFYIFASVHSYSPSAQAARDHGHIIPGESAQDEHG